MLRKFLLASLSILIIFSLIKPGQASAVFSLSGSNTVSHLIGSTLVVTDLQIGGSGTEPIPVKLRVTNGSLSMTTTTGLTFTGSSTGATLYFKGTLTDINNALATLKYVRSGSGSDTLEVSLVEYGEVFFSENSHLYKFITVSGGITANNAVAHAASQIAYDTTGYLATITSQAENDFVAARLQGDGWIGASDSTTEGNWKWITGPESGTQFWSGAAAGSPVNSRYSNWASGEPNDYSTGEDCAQFYITSSKWNDLPCTGNTLTGYVVEFGDTEDIPTVVAKNISITTVPIYTLSYTAGAHGSISGTLSQSVVSGNNGTGVTAIPSEGYHFTSWSDSVTSASRTETNVSGNISVTASFSINTYTVTYTAGSHGSITGTTTQTINNGSDSQSVTAQADTGYHFTSWSDGVTTATRSDINIAQNISVTASFATNDTSAPIISSIGSSSVDATQTVITWTTDENSSSQVQYGLVKAYGYSTTESDTSTRITNHAVTLSNLKSCAHYFFRVISHDSQNNSTASDQQTFTTGGCLASVVVGGGETTIPITGGNLELANTNSTAQLTIPNNYSSQTADFQINKLDTASAPTPPSGKSIASDNFYELLAITQSNESLSNFAHPITFTITYDSNLESNYEESSLDIYKFDGTNWLKKNCSLDITANTLTCDLNSFSTYAVLGNSKNNSSPVVSSSSPNSFSSPTCTDSKPLFIPDLFQINTTLNTAKIYFTPIDTNQFFVSFSTSPLAEENGEAVTLAREGVQSHTIYFLKPNTIYYLKVRGQNGCMPGEWSDIMKFTTNNSIYYKYFPKNSSTKKLITPKTSPSITPSIEPQITPTPSIIPNNSVKKSIPVSPKKCFLKWCW